MSRFRAKSWCVPHGTPLPPPPPGVRYVPVRLVGIIIADDELRAQVRRRFHWPMIILALMVLPLLAWELWWPPNPGTLAYWLSLGSLVIIWTAFFIEFVIKITIAESRFEYVRKNWLDLIVLALPALRPLRVAYVARTSRVFALRGVGMKFCRYVITILFGLEAMDRLMERVGIKPAKGRRKPEEMTRYQLIDEVKRLRKETDGWRAWHAGHQQFNEERGIPCYGRVLPPVEDTELEDAAEREAVQGDAREQSDDEVSARDHRAAPAVGREDHPPTIASACQSPSPN